MCIIYSKRIKTGGYIGNNENQRTNNTIGNHGNHWHAVP